MSNKDKIRCRGCDKMTWNEKGICAECRDRLADLKRDLRLIEEINKEII